MIRILLAIFVVLISLNSFSVMTQHNIELSSYKALAEDPRFATVGWLLTTKSSVKYGCTATLIDPRTLLTSAHCVGDLPYDQISVRSSPRQNWGSFTLSFNKSDVDLGIATSIQVIGARVFPTCIDTSINPELGRSLYKVKPFCDDDIALLYLARPVFFATYLPITKSGNLYAHLDSYVQIAGYGAAGNGLSLKEEFSGSKLATHMYIDRIYPDHGSGRHLLSSKFIWGPKEKLLGATAQGDSGAPVLAFDEAGQPSIIAVVRSTNYYEGDLTWNGRGFALTKLRGLNELSEEEFRKQSSEIVQEGTRFYGYGSRRYFVYTGNFEDFILKGVSYYQVQSNQPLSFQPQYWSHTATWKSIESLDHHQQPVNNAHYSDHLGALERFFGVTVTAQVHLDVDAEVDSVYVNGDLASLYVPETRMLAAFHLRVRQGELRVLGVVNSSEFIIERGKLAGSGRILLTRAPFWHSDEIGPHTTGALINLNGTLSQFSFPYTFDRLTIEGAYRHGAGALLQSVVASNGHSSLLQVSDDIILEGGTLSIEMPELWFNSESASLYQNPITRWTILSSNTKIVGRFDEVIYSANLPENWMLFLVYGEKNIEVVLQQGIAKVEKTSLLP